MNEINNNFKQEVWLGDCLELMRNIPDKSVDMVLCDLPYGTTQNKWDSVLDLNILWNEYIRISKESTPFVLTASQPFTTTLIHSNLKMFKYCWVWDKVNKFSGHLNAKKQPMRQTEDVAVFYKKQPTYNPQMVDGKPYVATSSGRKSNNYNKQKDNIVTVCDGKRYPRNLISIKGDERGTVGRIHPTQKPIELMEYLVKTYTNEGDLVLDNCAGSGSTLVAAKNLNRQFIGIEKEKEYYDIILQRLNDATKENP